MLAMPEPRTPKQMLAEHLYADQHGGDLRTYVTAELGRGQSWRAISADVSTRIGITVSRESLRLWYGEQESAA